MSHQVLELANQNTKIEQIPQTKCLNNENHDLTNTDKRTVATTRSHPHIRPMDSNFGSKSSRQTLIEKRLKRKEARINFLHYIIKKRNHK